MKTALIFFLLLEIFSGVTHARAFGEDTPPNMNGQYSLSPSGSDPEVAKRTKELFPKNFRDYPGGVEYFDVYSPTISSLYSQVFWKALDPSPLPEDVVKEYDGKAMAIVGFEVDQVFLTPDGEISVPINVAYNHHFESHMVGKGANFKKVKLSGPDDPIVMEHKKVMGHGMPSEEEAWVVEEVAPSSTPGVPTSQSFGGANGGEYRMSYHGYAPGFAQLIDSPTAFQITPMQIDTWNRDQMSNTGGRFVAGPEPRSSLAPKGAQYSGLLECPLTTRITKDIDSNYVTMQSGSSCSNAIKTAGECFEAVSKTFKSAKATNTTVSDAGQPGGCSAVSSTDGKGIKALFNNAASTVECGSGATIFTGMANDTAIGVTLSLELDVATGTATITLTGPSGVWFGVGFNASAMSEGPWAVVVNGGGDARVSEHKLADQGGPPTTTELKPSLKIISNEVNNNIRTVVVSRAMKGLSEEYYTFDPSASATLPYISAVGNSETLSYHKNKAPNTLAILPKEGSNVAGTCLCMGKPVPFGQAKGSLIYTKTNQSADVGSGKITFGNSCAPQPRTDMLAMQNPTCDVRSYVGGQSACHHMFSLLDADQEIPWADQPLVYVQKFRFYYQPYNASYHTNVKRTTWGIASPVEYDVPKCSIGIMGCSQNPDGTWTHTIRGTFKAEGKLAAAHFHCHAPTCLSVSMYNNATGELICREQPLYGGTGAIHNQAMDEPGFIAQPPCLWGSPDHGLEEPYDTNGQTLHVVKTANATYGHHGEMAWLQMYYF